MLLTDIGDHPDRKSAAPSFNPDVYVDIYIPSQNRCIEVKSDWTYNIKTNNIALKQLAAKELGYNYEIWVYDKKGNKTICYQ